MIVVPIFISTFLFIGIACLHFYWAFGGMWAVNAILPTDPNNEHFSFKPGRISTLIVALGCLAFAYIILGNNCNFNSQISQKYNTIGNYIIMIVFSIRAFGDFKYVGLTKKIHTTTFGLNDTRYFTPLCICISLFCLAIIILS